MTDPAQRAESVKIKTLISKQTKLDFGIQLHPLVGTNSLLATKPYNFDIKFLRCRLYKILKSYDREYFWHQELEEAEEESVEEESSTDQRTARVQVGRGPHTRDSPLGGQRTPQVSPPGPSTSSSSRVGIKFVHRPGSKS